MVEPVLPSHLVEARHTPLFDFESLPSALARSHRTTVWAELHVQSGSVRYVDLEGDGPRDERLEPGDSAVIVPGVEHKVEPSTDATFFVRSIANRKPAWFPDWRLLLSILAAGRARGSTASETWTPPTRSSRW